MILILQKNCTFFRFFCHTVRCVCVLWRILMSLDKPSKIKFALNSFHATWFQTTHNISLLFDVCAVIAVASFVLLFVSNLANCFEIWREEKSHTFFYKSLDASLGIKSTNKELRILSSINVLIIKCTYLNIRHINIKKMYIFM